MNRFGAAFWFCLATGAAFSSFMITYAVQHLENDLSQVRKQTVAEQLEIRVLHAEWSYLTQPARLAELNKQFLSLAPIATKQLQQSIAEIPLRAIPADPPAEMSASLDPAPAPQPAVRPEGGLPVTPVALKGFGGPPAPQPARPAPQTQAIDALFAQIASER